jgi:hypothetical protein
VAEMKLPGRAWLQFDVESVDLNECTIHQTAIFDPQGVSGSVYWCVLYPLHAFIFRGMLKQLAARMPAVPVEAVA